MKACIVVEAEDGCSTIIQEGFRKARKPHKCCECRKEISKGQKYYYEFTTFDGDTSQYRTCEVCKELRDKLFQGWIWGDLWYEIREFINNNPSASILDCSIGKLSAVALNTYLAFVQKVTIEQDKKRIT